MNKLQREKVPPARLPLPPGQHAPHQQPVDDDDDKHDSDVESVGDARDAEVLGSEKKVSAGNL